jgi:DNA-directed RNA polymerase specialized sigma24 family protein
MEDQRLIRQCRRGRREALRRIYDKYHVDLLKLAMVLTGEVHTAEDIVHDVFVHCESLPDDLSEFQIPPGAEVVEQ